MLLRLTVFPLQTYTFPQLPLPQWMAVKEFSSELVRVPLPLEWPQQD